MKPASGQHTGQAKIGCGAITIAPVSGWPEICKYTPAGVPSVRDEPTVVQHMHALRMSAWVLQKLLQSAPERFTNGGCQSFDELCLPASCEWRSRTNSAGSHSNLPLHALHCKMPIP